MKFSDKLTKLDECVRIYKYDNGYMVEASGRDNYDDWSTVKLLANSLDEANSLVADAFNLPQA